MLNINILPNQVYSTFTKKDCYIATTIPESTCSAGTMFFEHNPLLLIISVILTLTILIFLNRIVYAYNSKQTYTKITQIYTQLLDNSNNGEDIQNKLNQYFIMVKMQFAKKLRVGASELYNDISKITLKDIKQYLNKFDEDVLPSFLFGLIIISLLMGVIFLIFDSRIIEDINYPNLGGALIQLL